MSLPIGTGSPALTWGAASDGALLANGVRVTADHGWLNVRVANDFVRAGGPGVVTLRLALARDSRGVAMLTAQEVTCGARRYTSLAALVRDQPEPWIAALRAAIHDEIARRVERGTRLRGHGVGRSNANEQRRGPDAP